MDLHAKTDIEIDLEQASCALCGANACVSLHSFPPFAVVRCQACAFVYLSPRLTEAAMQQVYSSPAYFHGEAHGYDSYATQEEALRRTFRRFLQEIKRRGLSGGSLLEVGCGYGYLLAEAHTYFNSRSGTDYSEVASEKARESGALVFHGGIEAVPPGQKFECIIATQVIEHVYNPKHFVQELAERLSPGGTLILATPDIGSFWYPLFRRRWPSFKIPEHVTYFTEKSLRRLLTLSGLAPTCTLPYPHAFPLELVMRKFGLRCPEPVANLNFWLPRTTVAVAARLGTSASST